MIWVCVLPWLGLLLSLYLGATVGFNPLTLLALALALVSIRFQYNLCRSIEVVTAMPPRYWWLTGIGGALVAAIALVSIIKTETGWGWTWRGRSLKLPAQKN